MGKTKSSEIASWPSPYDNIKEQKRCVPNEKGKTH